MLFADVCVASRRCRGDDEARREDGASCCRASRGASVGGARGRRLAHGHRPPGSHRRGMGELARGAVPGRSRPRSTVGDVDRAIGELAVTAGTGSAATRRALSSDRLRPGDRASSSEFLVRVLGGELRQGASEGVLVSAIAAAADVPVADVRRASMMSGDLGITAEVALTEGSAGLNATHAHAAASRAADARLAGQRRRRSARRHRARHRWSGSSTARACRPTGAATTCASSRATSTTSPIASVVSSRSFAPCLAATSCSTGRFSA